MNLEELSRELRDQELTDEDDDPDRDKHGVGEETTANVDLVINFSGGNHVEDLHHNENVEENGKVARGSDILEGGVHELAGKRLFGAIKDSSGGQRLVCHHIMRFH